MKIFYFKYIDFLINTRLALIDGTLSEYCDEMNMIDYPSFYRELLLSR